MASSPQLLKKAKGSLLSEVLFSWANWVKGMDGERLPIGCWHPFFWEQGFGFAASGHGDLVTAGLSWNKGQAWGQARPENCPGTNSLSALSQVGQVSGSLPSALRGYNNTVLMTSGEHRRQRKLEKVNTWGFKGSRKTTQGPVH